MGVPNEQEAPLISTGLPRGRKRAPRRPFLRNATVYVIRRHQRVDASAPCHSSGGRTLVGQRITDFVVPD